MRCLLHGFTQGPASWDEVVAELGRITAHGGRDDARVLPRPLGESLCPALLGHGGGEAAATFDDEVDRIAALIETPLHLVGYSLGARIALGIVARHPARVRSALLVGVHPGLESEEERAARRASDERWAALALEEGVAAFVAAWEAQALFATQSSGASIERQRELRMAHSAEGLAAALRVLGLGVMPSRWATLRETGVPIRLVVGERDAKFRALAERITQVAPRAGLQVVAGVGHNVALEAPATLARAIAAIEAET